MGTNLACSLITHKNQFGTSAIEINSKYITIYVNIIMYTGILQY